MPTQKNAYLTVLSWPAKFTEADRIKALVDCASMDNYQAKLACRRNLPGVVTRLDPIAGARAAKSMQSRGVLCLSLTKDDIYNYPAPEFALGIEQFPDADPARFVVKSSTNDHWTFAAEDVKLAISGHIKSTKTNIAYNQAGYAQLNTFGSAVGNAMRNKEANISRQTKLIQLLDLHIESESKIRLVRLIGQRTHIGFVGGDPNQSLLDDTRPNEMVQILFPNTHLDTEFHDFDPPGDIRKLALKNGGKASTLTLESWAFYSPWIGLIRQIVYGW